MSVSSGSFTVGTGGDYANWRAVSLDIAATLTGNLTFSLISATSDITSFSWPAINVGAYTLKFTSSLAHLGNPLSGYKSSCSGFNFFFDFPTTTYSGAGRILFQEFYFSMTGSTSWYVNMGGTAAPVYMRNILAAHTGSAGSAGILFSSSDGSQVIDVFNAKLWCDAGRLVFGSPGSSGWTTLRQENISIYSTDGGGLFNYSNITANANRYIKNCVGYCAGTGSVFTNYNGIAKSYLASNDSSAAGTGSLTGITAGNFSSLSPLNANFLNLASSSSLRLAGTAPSIAENVYGIRGNDRPGYDGAYSIGADEADPIYSFSIAGSSYPAWQWPRPSVKPAIKWVQDSAGYWNGSDRGAAQDVYETTCVFLDKEPVINSLEALLGSNRESVTLSNFYAPIFAPNVDHTGNISATVVSRSRRHVQWGYPATSANLYALEVTFRAISPTLLGTSPSVSTLKLQDGFDATDDYTSHKAFTYNQTALYADHNSDTGVFKGRFLQKESQMKAILAYIMTTARASAVAFPNIGSAYPFGYNRGGYASKNCKVKSFSLERRDFVFWNLEIELVENS